MRIFSNEVSAGLRRAFGLADEESSPSVDIRHIIVALMRPQESVVVVTWDILLSLGVIELFQRAEQHAQWQGSRALERRHLYAALRVTAPAQDLGELSFLATVEDTVREEEVILGETLTAVEMEAGAERDPRTQR